MPFSNIIQAIQSSAVTSSSILDGAIVNADVAANAAVAFSKLASLTASKATMTDSNGVIVVSSTASSRIDNLANGIDASIVIPAVATITVTKGVITAVV